MVGCGKKTEVNTEQKVVLSKPPSKPKSKPTSVVLNPENCVIVLPAKLGSSKYISKYNKTIADELQKHLILATGVEIQMVTEGEVPIGKYTFNIQKKPDDDEKAFADQESRWRITETGAFFYGDTVHDGYWYGAANAVYSFLEDQLGVRWLEPGDKGIFVPKSSSLKLNLGEFNWIPELMFRTIRCRTKNVDNNLWKKRMRMGGSRPGGGHAFCTWWKKYGKTHPDYFALNKFGKREPVKMPKAHQTDGFVKICASNPGVVDQIIKNWLPRKKRTKYVSACMDDGVENFCECEKCKKLDVMRKGEKFGENLTDRYAYLANAVARDARKHRGDAWAVMYAYLTTIQPPRMVKLEPNVVVQIVPYVTPLDLDVQKKLFEGWRKAGARKMALRPNYHWKYLHGALPLGIEKQMFDVFQIVLKEGVVSVDYDSFKDNWAYSGFSNYVLAHAFAEPGKSFEHWEKEYYQGYGQAADDVKRYFRYWRNQVFEKRLKPNLVKIAKVGRYGSFNRGMMWMLHDNAFKKLKAYKLDGGDHLYSDFDFATTDAMLQKALKKELNDGERYRVNQLLLANQRSRLLFDALTTSGPAKFAAALKLRDWMKEHESQIRAEDLGKRMENNTGLTQCAFLGDCPLPWLKTVFKWRFKIDPKNVGLKKGWDKISWSDTEKWKSIRVNVHWSNTYESPHKELKKTLKSYDGFGWYAFRFKTPNEMKGREIYLRFGAVDDSCWVFVNGKKAGEHIFKKKGDENKSFDIRIDQQIDWSAEYQQVRIRVLDKTGKGGAHKPTWIVSKMKK